MSERPDPFAALSALAPTVDMVASREVFERSRSERPPTGRSWLLPAAVVILLVVGLVGVWAIARDDGLPTIPAAPIDDDAGYQVLLVAESRRESGTVDVATDAATLATALEPIDGSAEVVVDLDRSIAAVFTIAGNECPPEIGGFDVDGTTWSPRFVYGTEPCADIGITWAFVVGVDRDGLGDSVEFTLPTETLDGFTGGFDEPGPEHREVIAVEETLLPFGTVRAVTDRAAYEEMWAADLPGAVRPEVDFDRRFVVSFTLPDDACPDQLVQFRSGDEATQDRIIWEPQFEPPPGGCDQPLITRTYVVAIDRPAVDVDVTFRLAGNEAFGYETGELTVTVERARVIVQLGNGPDSSIEPDLIATDVVLPLPPVGEPQLHAGTYGIVWVVQHDDGTVSVLNAVVPDDSNSDEGGVEGLGFLVRPTETGDGFAGPLFFWDAHGRTLGPRADDLVGYAGHVVDGEVQLFLSTAARFDGEAEQLDDRGVVAPDLSTLSLLDLDELFALSFSGPTWRHLDATLVVEGGVGTLCTVEQDLPVPDLQTCDDGLATGITASDPDITSWFFGPVLAEFDDSGAITTIVPLGGSASRNDGALDVAESASADVPQPPTHTPSTPASVSKT